MNYTPEQFAQAVLKALETLNTPDVTKLPLQELKDLAVNPNTPPEILTILARDEDSWVRRRVADNPNYNQDATLKTQLEGLKKHLAAVQDILDNILP
jgi:hypothetical protein